MLKEAGEILKEIDPYPIVTWSDYYKMFFLATRFAHPEDTVKGFSEHLKDRGWEVIKREEDSNDSNGNGVTDDGSAA